MAASGAEARVDERHDLVAEVARVAADGGGVDVLRAAVAREAVGQHEDGGPGPTVGDELVHAAIERELPRAARDEPEPGTRVAGQHEDDGVAALVGVVAGWQVHAELARARVAERVVLEEPALVQHHLDASAGHRATIPQARYAEACIGGRRSCACSLS